MTIKYHTLAEKSFIFFLHKKKTVIGTPKWHRIWPRSYFILISEQSNTCAGWQLLWWFSVWEQSTVTPSPILGSIFTTQMMANLCTSNYLQLCFPVLVFQKGTMESIIIESYIALTSNLIRHCMVDDVMQKAYNLILTLMWLFFSCLAFRINTLKSWDISYN